MSDSWNSVYGFDSIDTLSTRVRRLERGRQYERRGSLVVPSGTYAGVPSDVLSNGQIDLASSTAVVAQGSISPFGIKGKFGFTATTTSITVYWDGTNGSELISILRADGRVIAIPGNSLTVSGLSPSTTYGFLPFWSAFNTCGIGWVVGDSGTPKFAFTAAGETAVALNQQSLQGREQLSNGYITYATTASGTSSGGGGGGGNCVMLGTDIDPLGDSEYRTEHHQQNDWIHIQAEGLPRSLNCTPDHPLYNPDKGKVRADSFHLKDWIITENGMYRIVEARPFIQVCTKVKVLMKHGHLFWANGYLSNNNKWFDATA